jgi:hypothetical protein
MNAALELDGYSRERAIRMRNIYHTLNRVYDLSERDGIAPPAMRPTGWPKTASTRSRA